MIQRKGARNAKTQRKATHRVTPEDFSFAPSRLRVLALCVFLLIFAFALRAHLLGAQSLWHDEGNSYVQATRSLAEIASNAARDIHPPLYYWMLAIWRGVAGESEFALRILSAFASLITVALVYAIGRKLFSPLAGIAAALFVALNTFSIYYAQEARMYALLGLWAAASVLALIAFFERPSWKRAAVLGVINAAGLWTQYAFPFVMIAQGIAAVGWVIKEINYRERIAPLFGEHRVKKILRTLGLYIAANVLAILIYLPWLPIAWGQITTWPNTGDPLPFGESLNVILNWFAFGITAQDAPLSIVVLMLILGLPVFRGHQSRGWWGMLIPVLVCVVPTGIFLAAGLFREANLKFLLPAQIGFALWLGRGVWMLYTLPRHFGEREKRNLTAEVAEDAEKKTTSSSATSALSAVQKNAPRLAAVGSLIWLISYQWGGVAPLYDDPTYQRADYRGIAAQLSEQAGANDAIILNAPNQEEVFGYYYRGDTPVYPLPVGLGGDDLETRDAVEQIIAAHDRIFAVFWGEAERDPNRVVEITLDSRAFGIDDAWVGDVRIARYAAPIDLPILIPPEAASGASSGVVFGGVIELDSISLSGLSVAAGDVLYVQPHWVGYQRLTTRYKVFVQLLNPDGTLAVQRDSEPLNGVAITTDWIISATVIDNHGLMIPPDLPSGDYTMIIGLYDSAAPYGRLAVTGGETNPEGDALVVTTIRVE